MTLEKSFNEDDRVFDQGDFQVVISKEFDDSYTNLEVNYFSGFLGKGFTINEKGLQSSGCC